MKDLWERMSDRAWRIFGPKNLKDAAEIRFARMMCIVFPSLALGLLLMIPLILLSGQTHTVLGLSTGILVALLALLFVRLGLAKHSLLMIITSPMVLAIYLMYNGSGIHDIAIMMYPGLIIIASLTLRKRHLALVTLLSIATIAAITFMEIKGIIFSRFSSATGWDDVVTIAAILIVTAVTARLLSDDLHRSIAQAEANRRALAESEEHYRSLVETSPDGIAIIDMAGTFIAANQKVVELLGCERQEEIIGQNSFQFIIPEDASIAQRHLTESMRSKTSKAVEYRIKRKEGGFFYGSFSSNLILDAAGNPEYFITNIRDISNRRLSEERLRRQNEALVRLTRDKTLVKDNLEKGLHEIVRTSATVLDLERVGVWIFTPEQRAIRCLVLFERSANRYSEGMELQAEAYPEYFSALLKERVIAAGDARTDPRTQEFSTAYFIPLGITSTLDAPIYLGEHIIGVICHEQVGPPRSWTPDEISFAGSMADLISLTYESYERHVAEAALRESEDRFRRLAEASFEGIAFSDKGVLIDANTRLAEMLGYQVPEMIGKNVTDFVAHEDVPLVMNHIQADSEDPYEHQALRKDGTVFPVEARGKRLPYRRGFIRVTALKDLTKVKQIEEERRWLETQIRQTQKMESLGTLAGGIAHDFNNIISIIIGHASTMTAAMGDPEKAQQKIQRIIETSERGATLVKQIMTFAQKTEIDRQLVDVNKLIGELTEMLRVTIPKTIEIVTDCDPKMPKVLMDPNQLHQALLNLCINARDAMSGFGTLTIRTSITAGEEIAMRFPEAAGKRYVQIRIQDTGVGMSDEIRERIFEPFFTTKSRGKGTGLGLTLVFGVLRSHNGIIDVVSKPGAGATFFLYFPVSEQMTGKTPEEPPALGTDATGSETILVAEDEESLRDLMLLALEGAGYTVMLARDGAEAIERYRRNRGKIDLVLTDMDLPRINGAAVCQMILATNEEAKIILFSGFMDASLKSDLLKRGVRDFIQKPYKLEALLRTVRRVLDE